MLTPQQQPLMTSADPLAMQFMTGGQMGYLPQAQYLTPSDYGAFRTLPVPRQHSFMAQDPGMFQSMLIMNQGSLFGLPKYTWNTYNPAVNQQLLMSHMTRQLHDQGVATLGAAVDTAIPMALGMFGGLPGMALGMMMPSLADPMVNRIRDMRAIQNMTMSRIVGGQDMNLATGMGFNASAGRSIDSFMRMQAAGDVLFKEGDYRKLMQLGVEHGMFDYANSAQQYKDIIKKLRNSMTTMMEVVGSTDFKDIMKEFKRMQTMGADISQFQSIARKENLFSRITGMSHTDMVNTYGQQGALLFSQAGLNNYQGSLAAMSNAAAVTLGQRMGLLTTAQVARHGGVSGMTQAMTQQDATAQNNMKDILLPYLMNGQLNGLDPNADLSRLLNNPDASRLLASGASKIRGPEQMMAYQRNRDNVWGEAVDKYGQDLLLGLSANMIGVQNRLRGQAATEFGYRQMGYSAEMAGVKANQLHSNAFAEQVEREAALERKKRREEEDLANNPFRKFARDVDTTLTKLTEATWGRLTGAYGEWSARTELEAAGFIQADRPFDSKFLPSADAAARGEGASRYTPGSYSNDAAPYFGEIRDTSDWFGRHALMLQEETGSTDFRKAMKKTSMQVREDGTLSGFFKDKGGASFGALQFTTSNMIAHMTKHGSQAERERQFFRKHGIDWSDERTQQILRATQAKIGAGNPNLTQEEATVLRNAQQGWKALIDDAELGDAASLRYLNSSKENTWNPFLNSVKDDSRIQLMLQDEGFRRYFYAASNQMGGGGFSQHLKASLKGLSEDDIKRSMSTLEGRQALMDRSIRGMVDSYVSNPRRPFRAGLQKRWIGKELANRKKELAELAAQGQSYDKFQAEAQEREKAASTYEAYIQQQFEEISKADRGGHSDSGDWWSGIFSAGNADEFSRHNVERILSEVNNTKSDSEYAERLRETLQSHGIELGSDFGAGKVHSAREFMEYSAGDLESHQRMGSRTKEHLEKLIGRSLTDNEWASLSKDTGISSTLAAISYTGKSGELQSMYSRNQKAYRDAVYKADISGKTKDFFESEYDGLSSSEISSVRSTVDANPWYHKMARMSEFIDYYNSSSVDAKTKEQAHAEIQKIGRQLGMSPDAIQKAVRDARLDVRDIGLKSLTPFSQKEIDQQFASGRKLATEHGSDDAGERISDYRKNYGQSLGPLPNELIGGAMALRRTGLDRSARKHGLSNYEELLTPEGLSRFEKAVAIRGTQEERNLARQLRGDLSRGLDLKKRLPHYFLGSYDLDGSVKAEDGGSLGAAATEKDSAIGTLFKSLQQQSSSPGASSGTAPGGQLTDGTVNKLTETLNLLTAQMRKMEPIISKAAAR